MKKLAILLLLLLLGAGEARAWEFNRSLSLGYMVETNILNETDPKWRKKDWAKEAAIRFGAEKEVAPGKRWIINLDFKNHENNTFAAYSRYYYGASVAFRQKLGLGLMAPWWLVRASLGNEQYAPDDFHTRGLGLFQVEYGKRISERTTVSGGLSYDKSRGKFTKVLDLRGVSASVRGQHSVNSKWLLTAGLLGRKGDTTVHAWDSWYSNYTDAAIMYDWNRWAGRYKVMYKVPDATTFKWDIGAIFLSGRDSNWKLGYEKSVTRKGNDVYRDSITRLQLNVSF